MGESSSSFPAIDRDYYNVVGTPNATGSPERRLLLAILERAILDYVGNDAREVQEAEDWLFGEHDESTNSQSSFSFAWVCEQLDLDRIKISGKIRSMPRRGNRKVAPWYFMKTVAGTATTH